MRHDLDSVEAEKVQDKQKPDVSPKEHVRLNGECVSQEDFPRSGRARQRLTLEVSSGPVRAGASKNQGAFRLKLRLKPPPAVNGGPQWTGPSATCLSSGAGGRGLGHDGLRPIACQCVSLAFRSDGHSHQLGAFCNERKENSVAAVTDDCDGDQRRFVKAFVLGLTRYYRARRSRNRQVRVRDERPGYFSLATTNSGAQSRARLISESGKVQIDLQAESA